MSSPFDTDDIMSMADDDGAHDDAAEPAAPAARFTHRVVPLEISSTSEDLTFSQMREALMIERLNELKRKIKACAERAWDRDPVIGVRRDKVTLEIHDDESAQALREELIASGEFHREMPGGLFPDATDDVLGYIYMLSRDAVRKADAEARSSYEETQDPPAFARLEKAQKEAVRALAKDLPMSGPETLHEVEELAAELHAEAPWLRDATTHIWTSMRENLDAGRGPCIKPVLIYGPPGSGKTSIARALARGMGAASAEIDVGAGAAGFRISGTEKGWASAGSGVPVETLIDTGCPNPVMIINEICEAGGGMTSTKGFSTSIVTALLQLLDVESAARFTCPALRVPFDMSRVSWVLTANDLDRVPAHLLSRVRRVYAPMPSADDVADIVRRRLGDLDPDLADHAAGLVKDKWKKKSGAGSMTLRQVEALCERVRRAAEGPVLH